MNRRREITIAGRRIGDDTPAWVVAEIGHNHQGSIAKALLLCREAKACGCDAVKFQKRTNRELFTKEFFDKPYNSEHAFGPTYGLHREALEFDMEQYGLIMHDKFLKEELVCFATAFDETAADFLEQLDVPCFKVASGDLTNLPLIRYIAGKGRPMILSTGGQDMRHIILADETIRAVAPHLDVAFLHCVALYPCPAERVNLEAIRTLRETFPDRVIGYSCHYNGISMVPHAYLFGARIMEKHFTLDHTWKGSDHSLSLQPDGMRRMVRDLRRLEVAVGNGLKRRTPEEAEALQKMEKCLYPARPLKAGHIISVGDLVAKSPSVPDGLAPYHLDRIVGQETNIGVVQKALVFDVSTSTPITEAMLVSL